VFAAGGSFPVSIAVHDNLVYVLNARDGGSVQGFWRIGGTLVKIPGSHRALGLDPAATPEFTHTPGQVAFTPDGSQIVVTTKGNTSAIDVFAVDRIGLLSATPVSTVEPGAVPFAVSFDKRGHLVVAEAGPSAIATFSIARDGHVTQLSQALTGQAATCWIAGDGTVFYTSNAGSGSVSGYRVTGGGGLTALGNTATDGGTVDATETGDGAYLYVETGAAGIVDGYRINHDGSLTKVTSVTVAGAVGAEGIAAS
jgi:6-phosphogluconolactonase (cycloisomerase 2 family)